MIKIGFFSSDDTYGPSAIPLFGPADSFFEKTASSKLVSPVVRYIETLKPKNDSQYVLVNALGASEFFGNNVNGDAFPEAALTHRPDQWTENPLLDAIRSKDWPYGFPTFYTAKPFAHHRNKKAEEGFGEIELACWNNRMKRVELVCRLDKDKCQKFGGVGTWDKLKVGDFPDVSMGSKVPFDTCAICLDWKLYKKAQAYFDPQKHKYEGEAVLAFHRNLIKETGKGIKGLSITRKDYCDHALKMMNRILPDGRKVFVYNDYPKFFDISFVFIGADKTAKTMMKIADGGKIYSFGGAELAEKLGYEDKAAEVGKLAKNKRGEIIKDVMPSQFASKAVPILSKGEAPLPKEILSLLAGLDNSRALTTSAGLGIVLRPDEFSQVAGSDPFSLAPEFFSPSLAQILAPLMASRSGLAPFIERRVVIIASSPEKEGKHSSLSSGHLHKIGAAYTGYRNDIMALLPEVQNMIESIGNKELSKLASSDISDMFTPLSYNYFKTAFLEEGSIDTVGADALVASAGVEKGIPSRNTYTSNVISGGYT